MCAKYGDKCPILQSTTFINRPAVITGSFYNQISNLITQNMTTLILTQTDIVSSLKILDTQVDKLLNLKVSNFSSNLDLGAGIGTIIKKIPTGMGTQFTILIIFMFSCILGIYVYKRRTLAERASDPLSTTEKGEFKAVEQNDHDDGLDKIEL